MEFGNFSGWDSDMFRAGERFARPYIRRAKWEVRKRAARYAMRAAGQYARRAAPYVGRALLKYGAIGARAAARSTPYTAAAITAGEGIYQAVKYARKRASKRKRTETPAKPKKKYRPGTKRKSKKRAEVQPDDPLPVVDDKPIDMASASFIPKKHKYVAARSRRSRSRRRPSRKRASIKRIKKVVLSMGEKKYTVLPSGDASTLTTNPQSLWVQGNNRYEFSRVYPAFGLMRINSKPDMPLYGTGFGEFLGRELYIQGYSIQGLWSCAQQTTESHASFARIHVCTMNAAKFPAPVKTTLNAGPPITYTHTPIIATPGAGRVFNNEVFVGPLAASHNAFISNRIAPVVLDDGNMSIANCVESTAVPNTLRDLCLFDLHKGDRCVDKSTRRVGWFNHGYKLLPGFNIMKTITIEKRNKQHQQNGSLTPWSIFIPMKMHLKELTTDDGTNQRLFWEHNKLHYFLLFEIVNEGADGTQTDNTTFSWSPPRLHFRDPS